MSQRLLVFDIGSSVTIGGSVKATVTGILVRQNMHVTYECTWWDGNTHNCKWLEQFEVNENDTQQAGKIGFSLVPCK